MENKRGVRKFDPYCFSSFQAEGQIKSELIHINDVLKIQIL